MRLQYFVLWMMFSGNSTIFPLTHQTLPLWSTTSLFCARSRGKEKKNKKQPDLDSHTYLTCFFILSWEVKMLILRKNQNSKEYIFCYLLIFHWTAKITESLSAKLEGTSGDHLVQYPWKGHLELVQDHIQIKKFWRPFSLMQ